MATSSKIKDKLLKRLEEIDRESQRVEMAS